MKSAPIRYFLLVIISVMIMQVLLGGFVPEQSTESGNRTESGWCEPDPEGESEGAEDEDGKEKYVAGPSSFKAVSAAFINHFTIYNVTDFALSEELISPPPRVNVTKA
jgi:hypothetical protein